MRGVLGLMVSTVRFVKIGQESLNAINEERRVLYGNDPKNVYTSATVLIHQLILSGFESL